MSGRQTLAQQFPKRPGVNQIAGGGDPSDRPGQPYHGDGKDQTKRDNRHALIAILARDCDRTSSSSQHHSVPQATARAIKNSRSSPRRARRARGCGGCRQTARAVGGAGKAPPSSWREKSRSARTAVAARQPKSAAAIANQSSTSVLTTLPALLPNRRCESDGASASLDRDWRGKSMPKWRR